MPDLTVLPPCDLLPVFPIGCQRTREPGGAVVKDHCSRAQSRARGWRMGVEGKWKVYQTVCPGL